MKSINVGNSVTLEDVQCVARQNAPVALASGVPSKLEKSRAVVLRYLRENKVMYGVTTGFGKLSDRFIDQNQIQKLQENLLLSHAAGLGKPFPEEVVRGMLLLRLHCLALGFSGVRPVVLDYLVRFLNESLHPIVPEQGSVGSSGDLAPLTHLALPLIGQGDVVFQGQTRSAKEALSKIGLSPLTLEAKEGLALINGTQAMTSLGALSIHDSETLIKLSDISSAMTLEALLCTNRFLDPRIHQLRPHGGQQQTASNLRNLVKESAAIASHSESRHRVQDAYSVRCVPQVHGAVRDAVRYAKKTIETEMNSVTDNPLVFSEGDIVSGGNFHGHPVALALDFAKLAISSLANIAERRIERLVNPHLNEGLPPFLTRSAGLESGFMLCQYTAAALVSENKILSHPASADSIPTDGNQEDYNSMGTIAGRHFRNVVENTRRVLSIELLCAAQALEFRRPLRFGVGVEAALGAIRKHIKPLTKDRLMKPDLDKIEKLVQNGEIVEAVEAKVGTLTF